MKGQFFNCWPLASNAFSTRPCAAKSTLKAKTTAGTGSTLTILTNAQPPLPPTVLSATPPSTGTTLHLSQLTSATATLHDCMYLTNRWSLHLHPPPVPHPQAFQPTVSAGPQVMAQIYTQCHSITSKPPPSDCASSHSLNQPLLLHSTTLPLLQPLRLQGVNLRCFHLS